MGRFQQSDELRLGALSATSPPMLMSAIFHAIQRSRGGHGVVKRLLVFGLRIASFAALRKAVTRRPHALFRFRGVSFDVNGHDARTPPRKSWPAYLRTASEF